MKNLKELMNKIKLTDAKKLLGLLGMVCFMCFGVCLGSVIYGVLGAGFGLTLGYVCGKLIVVA
jgi:hypothetical protein